MLSIEQIKFCAKECELQQSGEMSVYHMCLALDWAQTRVNLGQPEIYPEIIATLGKIVEPAMNPYGFRETPVQIGSTIIGWENIPHQINMLVGAMDTLSPEEIYQEFETIHPFRDGNGRVGQILFNWIRGSLDHPVFAPEFHKSS